ncbi:hydrogenase expression protein [Sphaerisporangium melleum]|uniref:Hydrogenase expression protein n=1 Tax=Sphaerisporangium melleum TaxID=321316 RepID=A0A917QXH6_9ACTN|nr:efflux RND transporter permease subunit [Sphaerisporangium melleum]GGK75426.1 hydrogenase expression protein [Sphaerisporangium melleum]GII72632.1 hydrogenase expression protein [Sphaerisporangium melleum]
MSSLARLSLANRGLVALITIVVAAFGLYTIPALKQQLLPSLSFPAVSIVAAYPGAAPQIVEDRVTRPLEDAVRGVSEVTGVNSTSRESSATVQISFDFGTDIEAAQNRVQQAVSRVDAQLPDGVDPQVVTGSTDDLPVVQLAVSSAGDQRRLADKLSAEVVPALSGVDGVRDVSVSGTRDQVVTIEPDEDELAERGLTLSSISTAIQSAGTPVPAGTLTRSGKSLTVQVGTKLDSVRDIQDLYLTPPAAPASQGQPAGQGRQPGGPGGAAAPGASGAAQGTRAPAAPKPVRLGDVASVKLGVADSTTLTRTNGRPSLGVSVTMKPDGNAVAISHDVRAKLPALATSLGDDTRFTVVFDQAPSVEQAIESLTTEGLLGLAMAVLVILVFLFSLRSTIVTAVSIPLSVLIALIALWVQDYSLNMLTLGALTIAIGRVVDDSIVVLENIKRHLSYGEDKRTAVGNGVREVAGAVTASTLTTVAVFLPIAFVGGLVGELFSPFAVTVTVALLASLLVALTVVPVLAYWFMKAPKGGDSEAVRRAADEKERRGLLQRAYVPVIRFATRHRIITLAVALVIFVGTLGLVPMLRTSFIEDSGQNTLSIRQTFPVSTSLASADAMAKKVEQVVAGTSEVQSYQVTVGGGSGVGFGGRGMGGGTSRASHSLTLRDGADAGAVERRLTDRFAAMDGIGEVTVGQSGGFGGNSLQVVVRAAELDTLRTAAQEVQKAMAGVPDVAEVTSSVADTAPRIDVSVDRKKAAAKGLSEIAIGQAVAQAFQGSKVTELAMDGSTADVVLRPGPAPESQTDLRDLKIAGKVKLDDVATVKQVNGPVEVTRIDGDRSATVSGKATGADLGATTAELRKRLTALSLPAGASYEIGGVSADQEEAFGNLLLALVAAIALVFFVMVATFRSLVQPLLLLVSIPFAATGAIGLLLVTDTSLGLAAMIGMLMLVGIVVTNAIVLMDLVNQYREQGMPLQEAVVEGGRRRLRPILMTALATIFALLPMALGITEGGGFISRPLAIVVIGGLISSTLLTLVLVPTLYTMVENRKEKARARRDRRRGAKRPPAPPIEEAPAQPVTTSGPA